MATLVLTTIGSVVGGPLGGALGAIVGQSVDRRILAPKGRRGPRLGDLTVQTSSYGSAIPKLFGTMRVAGTVIWASDLRESQETSGGGKGRPRATTFSYSASFAVLLSGRQVRAVRRIWADGKLLRGAAGDWKTETGFRLHLGGEDQDVDPLITSAEGMGGAPAYRGLAYAVFEDLQLADFGNRIPSLTFEVEADAGAISIAAIAETLSMGSVVGTSGTAVGGYAATGDSVRGALETFALAYGTSITDDGMVLRLDSSDGLQMLPERDLGASADSSARARFELDRTAAGALPDEVAITYYEPKRDYQAGLQRARWSGPGRRAESVDLPVALSADSAKAVAERWLDRSWTQRSQATVALPARWLTLRPGGLAAVPGRMDTFRIAGWTLERMVLELRLVGAARAPVVLPMADAGRPASEPDLPAGETLIELLDLPPLDTSAATGPRLWIAAAGTGGGWRRAQVMASVDGGTSFQVLGSTAPRAIMGMTTTALPPGDAALFDRTGTVEVELAAAAMWLEGRDDEALVNGANLAMIGDELIQFGAANPVGPRRFRLSRLLRGRRGSEWAMASHAAGERFVLVDPATLLPFEATIDVIGAKVRVIATGVGDATHAEREMVLTGRALRPPPPAHLSAKRLADGTIRICWVRRSRVGWSWLDGIDTPVGEEFERYRLTVQTGSGPPRTVDLDRADYDYSPAAQIEDGATHLSPIDIAVVQLGALGPSVPAARAQFIL